MLAKLKRYWQVFRYIYNKGAENLDESRVMYKRLEEGKYNLYGNNVIEHSTIGKHTYIAHNSILFYTDIGNYCSIGPNAVIGYGDHPTDKFSTNPLVYYNEQLYGKEVIAENKKDFNKRVTIGNDVWMGAHVFIKNGVTIGNGAIIGTGAVVLTDVGEYEIAVGMPAKIIKKRFDEETIQKIKASKWWESDIEELVRRKNDKEIQELLKLGEHPISR